MQATFKISTDETRRFSQVWNYKGLTIPLQDAHIQFATDFANVVLGNFIQQCQAKALEAKQQLLEKEDKKKIIMEGLEPR